MHGKLGSRAQSGGPFNIGSMGFESQYQGRALEMAMLSCPTGGGRGHGCHQIKWGASTTHVTMKDSSALLLLPLYHPFLLPFLNSNSVVLNINYGESLAVHGVGLAPGAPLGKRVRITVRK